MHRTPLRWKIEDAGFWLKRLAIKCVLYIFGLAALVGFGVVAVKIGAEALDWLRTGTWHGAKTIAEISPPLAHYVAGIKWLSVRRIALWVVSQSIVWAYVAFAIMCFVVFGYFLEVADDLETRRQARHSLRRD